MPAAVVAEAQAAIASRNATATYGVWPEHWHAVQVMQGMTTQWRMVAGMGGLLFAGMDYAAVPVVMRECRRAVPRRFRRPFHVVMGQLRVLERVLLQRRNDR